MKVILFVLDILFTMVVALYLIAYGIGWLIGDIVMGLLKVLRIKNKKTIV